jgi:hypothetical protein
MRVSQRDGPSDDHVSEVSGLSTSAAQPKRGQTRAAPSELALFSLLRLEKPGRARYAARIDGMLFTSTFCCACQRS